MIVRQCGKDWYVARVPPGSGAGNNRKTYQKIYRNWFLIKYPGTLVIRGIKFPKEFIGKRIRLKIEVMEDGN